MSEHPPEPPAPAGDEDGTTLIAGAPGPSGTGELTEAGADPTAPTTAPTSHATAGNTATPGAPGTTSPATPEPEASA